MRIVLEIDSRSEVVSSEALCGIFMDMAQAMTRSSAPYPEPSERICVVAIFTRDCKYECVLSGQLWLEPKE